MKKSVLMTIFVVLIVVFSASSIAYAGDRYDGVTTQIKEGYFYSHIAVKYCENGIRDLEKLVQANGKTLDKNDHAFLKTGEQVFIPENLLKKEHRNNSQNINKSVIEKEASYPENKKAKRWSE